MINVNPQIPPAHDLVGYDTLADDVVNADQIGFVDISEQEFAFRYACNHQLSGDHSITQ